jgi:hypothetical protein
MQSWEKIGAVLPEIERSTLGRIVVANIYIGRTGWTLAVVSATLITPFVRADAATVVKSFSYINLFDSKNDIASGINPTASTFVQSSNASASGIVTATSLKMKAESQGAGLPISVSSFGKLENSYEIIGNGSNVSIPLSFNFSLTGKMKLSSAPAMESPFSPFSLSTGAIDYHIWNWDFSQGNYYETTGGLTIQSQFGTIIRYDERGSWKTLLENNNSYVEVTPNPSVDTDFEKLNPETVKSLSDEIKKWTSDPRNGLSDTLRIPGSEFSSDSFKVKTGIYEGTIISLARNLSPSIGLPGGISLSFGYDADFIFESNLSLSQALSKNGRLDIFLDVQASASPSASSVVDYGNTLKLTSITVPYDFDAINIADLKVAFESGDIIPVTREARAASVPTPAMLPGLVALGINVLRRRKLAQ